MAPLVERHRPDRNGWWALGIFVANLAVDFGLVAATAVLHAKFSIAPLTNEMIKLTLVQLGSTGLSFANFVRYPVNPIRQSIAK